MDTLMMAGVRGKVEPSNSESDRTDRVAMAGGERTDKRVKGKGGEGGSPVGHRTAAVRRPNKARHDTQRSQCHMIDRCQRIVALPSQNHASIKPKTSTHQK